MEIYSLREQRSCSDESRTERIADLVEKELHGSIVDVRGTLYRIQMCGRIRPVS